MVRGRCGHHHRVRRGDEQHGARQFAGTRHLARSARLSSRRFTRRLIVVDVLLFRRRRNTSSLCVNGWVFQSHTPTGVQAALKERPYSRLAGTPGHLRCPDGPLHSARRPAPPVGGLKHARKRTGPPRAKAFNLDEIGIQRGAGCVTLDLARRRGRCRSTDGGAFDRDLR